MTTTNTETLRHELLFEACRLHMERPGRYGHTAEHRARTERLAERCVELGIDLAADVEVQTTAHRALWRELVNIERRMARIRERQTGTRASATTKHAQLGQLADVRDGIVDRLRTAIAEAVA